MWKKMNLDIDSKMYKKLSKLSKEERIACYNVLINATSSKRCGRERCSRGLTASKESIKKVKKELDHHCYKMKQDVYSYKQEFEFVDPFDILDDPRLSAPEQQEDTFERLEVMDIGVWLNKELELAIDESNAFFKVDGPWLRPWVEFVRKVYVLTLIESRSMKKNRRTTDKQLELLKRFLDLVRK